MWCARCRDAETAEASTLNLHDGLTVLIASWRAKIVYGVAVPRYRRENAPARTVDHTRARKRRRTQKRAGAGKREQAGAGRSKQGRAGAGRQEQAGRQGHEQEQAGAGQAEQA